MELSPEEGEFLAGHKWAVLSTDRRDGSPQSSLIGYHWDGTDAVITFPRASTTTRRSSLRSAHPRRPGCEAAKSGKTVNSLDTEDRTILRIHPTTVFLNT